MSVHVAASEELSENSWTSYGGNTLWIPVLALTGFGLLFVYSASSIYSQQRFGSEFYFAKKQALFLIPAFFSAYVGSQVSFQWLFRYLRIPYIFFLMLAFATHIHGLGRNISGAPRWIGFGPFGCQPAEFLKIFTLIFFVSLLTRPQASKSHIKVSKNFQKHLSRIDFFLLLLSPVAILAQKDLGTTVVLMASLVSILFVAGFPKRYFFLIGIFFVLFFVAAVLFEPYRMARVMTFLNPFQDPLGAGFQVIQSFVAVANGGLLGRGIGESQQKLFFLPEAHTDFILSVISEEIGFVGILVLCLLFLVLFYAMLRIILSSPRVQDRLLVVGFLSMLISTTIINMAVVVGALPTKGLPLPFISNGGTALISNYFVVGICAQISNKLHKN